MVAPSLMHQAFIPSYKNCIVYVYQVSMHTDMLRSYYGEYTGSHQIPEVKHH